MAVAASYSNALAKWSTNSRFLLNLPMFGREPFHADVEKLVGCFTSSLMLDIDLSQSDTPAGRTRAVQETLHSTANHSSYSGLSVLRDLGRHRGNQTLAPIVYTSALGLGDLFAGEVTDQFGVPVWTISQGPQVLIDAQATPLANGLMINWDVRVDAFRPGVADAMFAYHLAELSRLAADDSAWDTPDPPAVPEAAARHPRCGEQHHRGAQWGGPARRVLPQRAGHPRRACGVAQRRRPVLRRTAHAGAGGGRRVARKRRRARRSRCVDRTQVRRADSGRARHPRRRQRVPAHRGRSARRADRAHPRVERRGRGTDLR